MNVTGNDPSAPRASCAQEVLDGDVLVYTLSGDLDHEASGTLAFDVPLDAVRAVVVDLREVTFFDSTALNALLHLRTTALDRSVGVHLAAVPSQAARVLEITDVAPLFPSHTSTGAALEALGG